MSELELLIDFHKDSDRQGFESDENNLRVLNYFELDQNKQLKLVDIARRIGNFNSLNSCF